MIGCEIHFKRENKELQLLSTERQDKAKVTAVRSLYYHSPLFTDIQYACRLTLVTWHCFLFFTNNRNVQSAYSNSNSCSYYMTLFNDLQLGKNFLHLNHKYVWVERPYAWFPIKISSETTKIVKNCKSVGTDTDSMLTSDAYTKTICKTHSIFIWYTDLSNLMGMEHNYSLLSVFRREYPTLWFRHLYYI